MTGLVADPPRWGVAANPAPQREFRRRSSHDAGCRRHSVAGADSARSARRVGTNGGFAPLAISACIGIPAFQSLLELAEACDVPVRFACRTGVCHNCETALIAGFIHPLFRRTAHAAGERRSPDLLQPSAQRRRARSVKRAREADLPRVGAAGTALRVDLTRSPQRRADGRPLARTGPREST